MVKRLGGFRRKSRSKLRKNIRLRGKLSLRQYFQKFKGEEKVSLSMEPSIQSGVYNLRFHGKIGVVTGQKGSCYTIDVRDGNKMKNILVHPVHLRRVV